MAALLVVAAIVAVTLLTLTSSGGGSGGFADPDSPSRQGSRALAQVLRDQGVDVEVVRTIRDFEAAGVGPTTTVLMGSFDFLGEAAADRASRHASKAARLVLLEPSAFALSDFGVRLAPSDGGRVDLAADCGSDLIDRDDRLDASVTFYQSTDTSADGTPQLPAGAAGCFPGHNADAAVVVLPSTNVQPETVVLGSADALTNARVGEASHAAIGLRALGGTARLVWYLPDISDLDVPDGSGNLRPSDRGIPEWFGPATLLLGLAFIAFALARGRRLGRIVTEPLPVVVRAVETTEARGRLYRRAGDRERAASSLRAGTVQRLAARLGLPSATADEVVAAVARTANREASQIRALLDGPTPTNDRDLVLLAEQLAHLEENVRHA